MRPYAQKDLDEYLKDDWVLKELQKYPEDNIFISQKWLFDIPAKRMIYADVYEEFLKTKGKRILDIGGGFCSLSRKLIENHSYTLVDVMTAGNGEKLKDIEKEIGRNFWQNKDWDEFETEESYDLIIANDIFPNVDQRLGKFLRKFKGKAKRTILTITCYDQKSWLADWTEKLMSFTYNKIKRVNGDKIIFVRAPSTDKTSGILKENLTNPPVLEKDGKSIFKNGRAVYKIEI